MIRRIHSNYESTKLITSLRTVATAMKTAKKFFKWLLPRVMIDSLMNLSKSYQHTLHTSSLSKSSTCYDPRLSTYSNFDIDSYRCTPHTADVRKTSWRIANTICIDLDNLSRSCRPWSSRWWFPWRARWFSCARASLDNECWRFLTWRSGVEWLQRTQRKHTHTW